MVTLINKLKQLFDFRLSICGYLLETFRRIAQDPQDLHLEPPNKVRSLTLLFAPRDFIPTQANFELILNHPTDIKTLGSFSNSGLLMQGRNGQTTSFMCYSSVRHTFLSLIITRLSESFYLFPVAIENHSITIGAALGLSLCATLIVMLTTFPCSFFLDPHRITSKEYSPSIFIRLYDINAWRFGCGQLKKWIDLLENMSSVMFCTSLTCTTVAPSHTYPGLRSDSCPGPWLEPCSPTPYSYRDAGPPPAPFLQTPWLAFPLPRPIYSRSVGSARYLPFPPIFLHHRL